MVHGALSLSSSEICGTPENLHDGEGRESRCGDLVGGDVETWRQWKWKEEGRIFSPALVLLVYKMRMVEFRLPI